MKHRRIFNTLAIFLAVFIANGILSQHALAKSAVVKKSTTVYSKPSKKKSKKKGKLKKGQKVKVLKEKGKWTQVKKGKAKGWVRSKSLEQSNAAMADVADGSRVAEGEGQTADSMTPSNMSRPEIAAGLDFGLGKILGGGSVSPWNVGFVFLFNVSAPQAEFYVGPYFRYFAYSFADTTGLEVDGKIAAAILQFGLSTRLLFGEGSFRWGPNLGLGYSITGVTFQLEETGDTAVDDANSATANAFIEASQSSALTLSPGLNFVFAVGDSIDLSLGANLDLTFASGQMGKQMFGTLGLQIGF